MISSHLVLGGVIAAKRARRRHVAGSCGKPNAGIDPARKGGRDARNNRVAGERGRVRNSKPPRTHRRSRRARVITHVVWEKNLRAIGQVAMKASIARLVLPGSVSVRPFVVRPYVWFICGTDVGKMSASRVR